jgi:NO-binding membrane sensor protein with MHYT domain
VSSALRTVLCLVAAVLLAVVGAIGLVTDVSTEPNPTLPSVSCGTAVSRIDHGTGGWGMSCDNAIMDRRMWAYSALLLSVLGAAVALATPFRPTDTTSDATPPAA